MEKLPLSVARKLLTLNSGELIPGSQLPQRWRRMLINEGIVTVERTGRTKTRLKSVSLDRMASFLSNKYGISDLQAYIKMLEERKASGLVASEIASDTKLRYSRTFQGFLVNVIAPLEIRLNGVSSWLFPTEGTFTFIYDYQDLEIASDIQIIGVENPESFRHIKRHLHLFPAGKLLFVSRYPQNLDLIRWLQAISNQYLHFGDIDLAGIAIFENEFRKHLGERASFLIPPDVENMIAVKGSRKLYNQQYYKYHRFESEDQNVQQLIQVIHRYKKGLEQEGLH